MGKARTLKISLALVEQASSWKCYQREIKRLSRWRGFSQETREQILKDFTLVEQAVVVSVHAASNVEDLTKFAGMSKYFRGEHHLEEMMYHEDCPRSVLLQLIDKFRLVLVKHEHGMRYRLCP